MTALTKQDVDKLEERVLGTAAAARFLDVHPVTLRKWRAASSGPAYSITDNGRIRYQLAELRRFARGEAT